MSGNRHYCTRTVRHKHIIRNPDRNRLACCRVYRPHTGYLYACLILCKFASFKIALLLGKLSVFGNLIHVVDSVRKLIDQRMLRRDNHVCSTEYRVGSCGEYLDILIGILNRENHLCTFASTYPVDLLSLDRTDEVQIFDIIYQALRIIGDAQHPLASNFLYDRTATAIANTIHDLLICKANFAGRAEIYGHLSFICETLFVKLKEYPLCPLVI